MFYECWFIFEKIFFLVLGVVVFVVFFLFKIFGYCEMVKILKNRGFYLLVYYV